MLRALLCCPGWLKKCGGNAGKGRFFYGRARRPPGLVRFGRVFCQYRHRLNSFPGNLNLLHPSGRLAKFRKIRHACTGRRLERFSGAWRSLVAHLLWEQGAVGSNPTAPTSRISGVSGKVRNPCRIWSDAVFFRTFRQKRASLPEKGKSRSFYEPSGRRRRFRLGIPILDEPSWRRQNHLSTFNFSDEL